MKFAIPASATGPMGAERQEIVDSVAHDWRSDDDWKRFVAACVEVTTDDGLIDPNEVRRVLTNEHGLTIAPRRLSAFWSRASSATTNMLENAGWTENTDHAGGNAGKPIRLRKWRDGVEVAP